MRGKKNGETEAPKASFKKRAEVKKKTKADYLREKETYPVPFVHLPIGDMDIIIGPKRTEDSLQLFERLGIKIKPTSFKLKRDGKPDVESIKEDTMSDDNMSILANNMGLVGMVDACSMTREPKIYPTPKEGEERDPDLWYWDDLHELDQQVLLKLREGKGIQLSDKTFQPG